MNGDNRQGLREAHAHIAAHGEALSLPNLAGCRSVRECLEAVREACHDFAARSKVVSVALIRLIGARVEGWDEPRWPTLAEIDAASGGAPCVIMSFDSHCALANTAAMRVAGLRAGESVPPNGVVCTDASGGATGLLLEQAAYRAWGGGAREPTMDQRETHVAAALEDLTRHGFVEVHDLHSQEWLGPMLSRLARAGRLPVERVWLYPPIDRLETHLEGSGPWECERVVLAGGKVFADGTLNSRTALMLDEYESGPCHDCAALNTVVPGGARHTTTIRQSPDSRGTHGKAMISVEALEEAIRLTARLGVGLAVHAIGDGAVRMVLDAWERVGVWRSGAWIERRGVSVPRLRIEHCEVIDAADIGRFAALGVVCSVQPCHLLTDIEALRRYLPRRLDRVLPLRELIDSGCVPGGGAGPGNRAALWFGSDVPIVRPDLGDSVLAATKRRREGTREGEAIGMGQAITEGEAWAGFGCFQAKAER